MIPPELRKMLVRIAGTRAPGPIQISAGLVGGWTGNELVGFGFRQAAGDKWLAPADWKQDVASAS